MIVLVVCVVLVSDCICCSVSLSSFWVGCMLSCWLFGIDSMLVEMKMFFFFCIVMCLLVWSFVFLLCLFWFLLIMCLRFSLLVWNGVVRWICLIFFLFFICILFCVVVWIRFWVWFWLLMRFGCRLLCIVLIIIGWFGWFCVKIIVIFVLLISGKWCL